VDQGVTKGLDEIHNLLVAEDDLDSTLRVIAEIATRVIDGCDCAGITLVDNDEVQSTACTDDLCAEIDRDQYITGEGPCVDAIRRNAVMRLGNAETDDRWPQFGALANRHGVKSVLGTPLEVRGKVMGALNLYGKRARAFHDEDVEVAALLGAHAAIVLANVQAFEFSTKETEHLSKALESRGIIERAKGILMEREKCSADEAFRMLVRASQTLNQKLREVAREVAEDAEGPDHSAEAGKGKL
jgi:GAF domain-containing protein